MLDARLLKQVDQELRNLLGVQGPRPESPEPVRLWPHATPNAECLKLLGTLLRFSERCTTDRGAFGYCWNQAMRVVAGVVAAGRSLAGLRLLEVGAGVENPLGVSMVLMMLGAERSLTTDSEALLSPAAAAETTLPRSARLPLVRPPSMRNRRPGDAVSLRRHPQQRADSASRRSRGRGGQPEPIDRARRPAHSLRGFRRP